MNDCTEALVKIKLAFRPGVVDLPEGQVRLCVVLGHVNFHALLGGGGKKTGEQFSRECNIDIQPSKPSSHATIFGQEEASANAINVANFNEFDMQVGVCKDV